MDSTVLRLVGAREIATRLGRSRQRIQQLAEQDDFPEPFQELAMGRVWWEHDIEDWIHRARDGDPAGDVCGDDAIRELAERIADHLAERDQIFVDGDLIGALVEILRPALRSLRCRRD
ncbi:helix-turn-helix transcriptional regulator [Actinoplanes palleronii]|uniref:AlpA family transcriptional regulator n=1 Tax=Actinoplanes palleronii TaxID=113570 RepID=A0ABQ4BIK6_9ACTN|nr:hypothetical protein [Actinoplanes palleronii]GIE70503.1 hypothetical protein Apa02nite_066110 [Actinoplanes palleronii]